MLPPHTGALLAFTPVLKDPLLASKSGSLGCLTLVVHPLGRAAAVPAGHLVLGLTA